jgi:threonine/homoserine/homoserine lactone efflux protein
MTSEGKDMTSILLNGFLTGLLLQIAIGPVFFFILNLSLQRTLIDGLIAVIAVTIVDYLFIVLAVLGVGKLLEKPKMKIILGITSSIVLILFGIAMMLSIKQAELGNISNTSIESDYMMSFVSTFFLTISSPLTIVFWTSLFAAKAIEMGYTKRELVFFGISAGAATFIFLGFSVLLFSLFKASIPIMLLQLLNSAVGLLLIAYGLIRLFKIVLGEKKFQKADAC